MYESILVATDGSETATAAAEQAIELARRFDAALYAISVLESRTEYDNAIVDPEEADRRRRARAEEFLGALEVSARDAGVGIETEVRAGPPHEEILAYATECGADLIVAGARGRSSLRRALLGSTVDRLVRSADRPVLVVDGDE